MAPCAGKARTFALWGNNMQLSMFNQDLQANEWHGVAPREWQRAALPLALAAIDSGKRGVVSAVMGCHARGQRILMFDGSVKTVESVAVGDLLMGPDSTPRRVLSLCRGNAEMFDVTPIKGEPWRVNGDHVLTFVDSRDGADAPLRDLTVHEWLKKGTSLRELCKQVRSACDFPPRPEPFEPYFIGVMLGDGTTLRNRIAVCTPDREIVQTVREIAEKYGATVRVSGKTNNKAADYFIRNEGALHEAVAASGISGLICDRKFIPDAYRLGSRETRLQVLAGLLDTDGHLLNKGFDFISKSKQLSADVVFVCRSLGLAAYLAECEKSCQTGARGTYWRVSISGHTDMIPTRVARKMAAPRLQPKNALRSGFSVTPSGTVEPFYGFQIDGDNRYLLDDFTITHNSGKSICAAEIVCQRMPKRGQVTVVTAPTIRLVKQLASTIADRIGADRVGHYFTEAKEIRDVIVCCQPSLGALALELQARGLAVSLWLGDEVHKNEAASCIAAVGVLNPASAIGFTATPFRALKTQDLSLWTELIYEYGPAQAFADGVIVKPELIHWTGGDVPLDDCCMQLIHGIRKVGPGLVNAKTIADADSFADRLNSEGVKARAVHSRLSPDEQAAVVASLKSGKIEAMVHVNMLAEGVDFPWLRWLCMRRPVVSRVRFCQEVGRVIRSSPGKTTAYLLDPHDLFHTFGLTYEAMLAGSAEAEDDENADDLVSLAKEVTAKETREPDDFGKTIVNQKLNSFRAYVRRLYLAFLCDGIVDQKITSTAWRPLPPSDRQLGALQWAMAGMASDTAIPIEHRKALKAVSANAAELTKGEISDLLSINFALKNRRKAHLPWPKLTENA